MKCDCGLSYVPGNPDDEKYHAQIHAEYLSGPEIPAVYQLSPCVTDGALLIYVVDGTCPMAIRRDLAHVVMVAHRSMTSYPAGYDGTVTENDQRLYIAADGAHIVVMVLTALDDRFWRLGWKADGSIILIDQVASIHRSYKIARIWTAAAYRREGLAFRLIQTASRLLPCNITDLGWELPFTPSGTYLVKRFCPDFFWGCGDPFSLHEMLEAVPT